MKSFLQACRAFAKCQSVARLILFTVLAFATVRSASADSITGGAVTGDSAFTAGGTFVNLTVPWGAVTTPANTVGDANFGTPDLYGFAESPNFVLTSPLGTQVGQTSIPTGTTVNSFFVTFEPGGSGYNLIGYVTFNAPVLGIITSDASLSASNFLGDAGITYLDPANVGLEAGDLVTIDTSNPNRIDWDTAASTPGDSVRVILGAPLVAVPEPSTLLISYLGVIGLVAVRMRRSR